MRSFLIILTTFFLIHPVFGADKIDSLHQELEIHKENEDLSEAIQTLRSLGEATFEIDEFNESLDYYQQALRLSIGHSPKEEETKLLIETATALFWVDKNEESLRYYFRALENKAYLSEKREAILYSYIGQNYKFLGNYPDALAYYYKSLLGYESLNDSLNITMTYLAISEILASNDQLDKALEEGLKSYETFNTYFKTEEELAPDKKLALQFILFALGDIEYQRENLEKAESYAVESLALAKELEDDYSEAFSNGLLGKLAHENGEYYSAEHYFQKALEYLIDKSQISAQARYQRYLGMTYLKQNRFEESITILYQALAAAKSSMAKDVEKDIYESLSISYSEIGDYSKSNEFLKKFMILKDSVVGEANQQQINELREKYEIQKREAEIETIKAESQERLNRLYVLAIIIGLVFFLIIFWLLYSGYKAKAEGNDILLRKNKEIAHQNKQLSSLNDDLLKFSEIVSHDLQGSLQKIRSLSHKLGDEELPNQEEVKQIESYIAEMEEVLYGLIMYSMTGSKEDMFELVDSKEVIVQTLQDLPSHIRNKSTKVSLHNLPQVLANKKKLSQLFLYLVSYSLEHQTDQASIIKISSDENIEEYEFIIQHDGPGIPREQVSNIFNVSSSEESTDYSSIELAISRKIVEQHKGKIWIESKKDVGTSFHFTIPKTVELMTA
ncbi:MAG: tetratricopeptide repeat protein [Bacteroidota bacterium]